ncbi:MAG: prepilin-type N-terminal cleavage/methylation domain-containing protein [Candidatus Electrothrix sp. MAN1_4]|nr:prepilin-type N-terminal cleavage/methylation domain-containing protein [Candidatus Electrothrix sp. MAN1_4]
MRKKKKISDPNGFSFVELMVVIALVGILSAISLPNFLRNLPEKRLKNAARNLYVDLQKARLLAVKENTNVTFTFDTAAGQYSFTEGGTVRTESLTDYGAVKYGCGVTVTTTNSWRASTDDPDDSIPTSGVTDDIIFTNLGVANTEDIYLQSNNDQTVCYAVTVSMLGSVKILRYNGSTWE